MIQGFKQWLQDTATKIKLWYYSMVGYKNHRDILPKIIRKNNAYFFREVTEYKAGWPWLFQKKNPYQYFPSDVEAIQVLSGMTRIFSKYLPLQKDEYFIPFKTPVVRSVETFTYGIFTCDFVLNMKNWDWPSFWLFSTDGIGEIDIFEGYRDGESGEEWLDTTIHYGDYGVNHKRTRSLRAMSGDIFNVNAILVWTEDKIEIYLNNILVRRIVDKRVLSALKGKQMEIIFQQGVMPEKAQMGDLSDSGWLRFGTPTYYAIKTKRKY